MTAGTHARRGTVGSRTAWSLRLSLDTERLGTYAVVTTIRFDSILFDFDSTAVCLLIKRFIGHSYVTHRPETDL